MNGSYNFLFHLVGFGLLSALFVGNFILDRKFRAEKEWGLKLYIAGIMRSLGILSPFVTAILLITGIGNIHNLYSESPEPWYTFGWLVAKLIFFTIMAINGMAFGPQLSKKRAMLVKSIVDKNAPADAEAQIKKLNGQISLFFAVQTIFFFAILFLTVFGTGKHPGTF